MGFEEEIKTYKNSLLLSERKNLSVYLFPFYFNYECNINTVGNQDVAFDYENTFAIGSATYCRYATFASLFYSTQILNESSCRFPASFYEKV